MSLKTVANGKKLKNKVWKAPHKNKANVSRRGALYIRNNACSILA